MSADGTKPPPFYCPACGKKHRADLSALVGHEGANAKVTCQRCDVVMTLYLGSDGLPKCELRDAAGALPDSSTLPPAAASPASAAAPGGKMPNTLVLSLVASAVVAAVVSLVAGSTQSPGDGSADRIARLEAALEQAQAEIAALKEASRGPQPDVDTDAIRRAVRSDVDALRKTVSANSAGIDNLTQVFQKANETFTRLADDYKALNGRIESNYQKGRELDKRLKAVEGD